MVGRGIDPFFHDLRIIVHFIALNGTLGWYCPYNLGVPFL